MGKNINSLNVGAIQFFLCGLHSFAAVYSSVHFRRRTLAFKFFIGITLYFLIGSLNFAVSQVALNPSPFSTEKNSRQSLLEEYVETLKIKNRKDGRESQLLSIEVYKSKMSSAAQALIEEPKAGAMTVSEEEVGLERDKKTTIALGATVGRAGLGFGFMPKVSAAVSFYSDQSWLTRCSQVMRCSLRIDAGGKILPLKLKNNQPSDNVIDGWYLEVEDPDELWRIVSNVDSIRIELNRDGVLKLYNFDTREMRQFALATKKMANSDWVSPTFKDPPKSRPNFIQDKLNGAGSTQNEFALKPVSKSELIKFIQASSYSLGIGRRVVELQNSLHCREPIPPDMLDAIISVSDTRQLKEVAFSLLIFELQITKPLDAEFITASYTKISTEPPDATVAVDNKVATVIGQIAKCKKLFDIQTLVTKELVKVHSEREKTILFLRTTQRVLKVIGKG